MASLNWPLYTLVILLYYMSMRAKFEMLPFLGVISWKIGDDESNLFILHHRQLSNKILYVVVSSQDLVWLATEIISNRLPESLPT